MGRAGRLSEAGSRSRHLERAPEHLGPGPVRTCVGCKERDLAARLVRVALADSTAETPVVVLDTARRMPGRGAWLHPATKCLDLAERRRAFGRALRVAGPVDTRGLREQVEAMARPRTPVGGEA